MKTRETSFGSDNHSGVHPRIWAALAAAAETGHCHAYGDDSFTREAEERLRAVFGPRTRAFFVFNGTGANVLALKTLTCGYRAVVCASTAHIHVDECGAPERVAGCKLLTVDTPDGKLTPEAVEPLLGEMGNPHHAQPGVVSVSQPTELGTLYTPQELARLASFVHARGLKLHVDGSRFANAVAALGCDPRAISSDAGVDVLSLGGTKNGLLMGEAVLFFDDADAGRALFERKQIGQLYSKMRFVAAQFTAYLADGLWLEMAAHSNRMARRLAEAVGSLPGVAVTQKPQTNGVFVRLSEGVRRRLLARHFFYMWNEAQGEARFMCSFDTSEEEVDRFAADIAAAVAAERG